MANAALFARLPIQMNLETTKEQSPCRDFINESVQPIDEQQFVIGRFTIDGDAFLRCQHFQDW